MKLKIEALSHLRILFLVTLFGNCTDSSTIFPVRKIIFIIDNS